MGILTVVVDSRGACVPYLEIMERLWHEGVDGLTYVSDDLRTYVQTLNAPTIVDRFNFAQFSAGNALYESSDNALALILNGRQVTKVWVPSAMQTIAAAAQEGRFIPDETVVISNGGGLLLMGHFLLALGIKTFICLEPYRLVDWKGIWRRDRSHFVPDILPKALSAQFFRILLASQGKQKADEFFGNSIAYDFAAIKAAIQKQLYMYSPQLVDDQDLAYGYPYPLTTGHLSGELANFIAAQRKRGKRIIAFTIGSMDVSQARKTDLIDQFKAGVRALGDTAGIILGDAPAGDEAFFSTLEFVPYTALFPQVDLLVTHGGAGTTHLALFTGTPVLNIPFVKDQFDWAARLKTLGMQVGMIPQKQFTATRFATTVNQNFTQGVVAAARRAGETERNHHNNPRTLLDELIAVAEGARSHQKSVE